MTVTLYSNISANGRVLLSENEQYQLPSEVIEANMDEINKAGNLVMGRKSFENFARAFGGITKVQEVLPQVALVCLSGSAQLNSPYAVAHSPEQVVQFLSQKGFSNIFVAGGLATYTAFLKSGLVTDVILHIAPVITNGGTLALGEHTTASLKLIEHKILSNDIVRLHYRKV